MMHGCEFIIFNFEKKSLNTIKLCYAYIASYILGEIRVDIAKVGTLKYVLFDFDILRYTKQYVL